MSLYVVVGLHVLKVSLYVSVGYRVFRESFKWYWRFTHIQG